MADPIGWPWLGTKAATDAINRLWPETDDERRAREQRERNDAIYDEAIRRWFHDTEPLR